MLRQPNNKAKNKTFPTSTNPTKFSSLFISLNCARNSNATISTIQFYASLSECIAYCLQEPWCNTGNVPPSDPDFNCFYSSPLKPKCVIYICRSPALNAYISYIADDSFIGVTLQFTSLPPVTLYNLYSPGYPTAFVSLLEFFTPSNSASLIGDLNGYHE
jgi:hypothetical protein